MESVSANPRASRKFVAIVSLDVAGYTRLMERDETATLAAVQSVFNDRIGGTIGAFGGSVFKSMGDGLLTEFASVL